MACEVPRAGENRLLLLCLPSRKRNVLVAAGAAVLAIALLDWRIGLNVSLGAFYVLPVIVAGTVLRRPHILLAAVTCGVLRVAFNPASSILEVVLGFAMASAAYAGAGLFVAELVRNRQLALMHMEQMTRQQSLRREAEEQLRILAESSPAAIMTIDASGCILAANRSAHDLLAFEDDQKLVGEHIDCYLPVLADALKLNTGEQDFRTAAQCRGRRRNGAMFVAHTWFSTYASSGGRRLAAIAVDSSEEVREREEQNLRQLQQANRIVAGAVSHDIRNLCAAVAVVHSNLKRLDGLQQSEDFRALGDLVEGLGKIASTELRSRSKQDVGKVELSAVLDELRIIIEPSWEEIGGVLQWRVADRTVTVVGDPSGLLQSFLNVAHNSHRAVQASAERWLEIGVQTEDDRVVVRFHDSGPGVTAPEVLFQPFQPGAQSAGMGLYVSRALVRSYGGELRHERIAVGCCFVVELQRADLAGPEAA